MAFQFPLRPMLNFYSKKKNQTLLFLLQLQTDQPPKNRKTQKAIKVSVIRTIIEYFAELIFFLSLRPPDTREIYQLITKCYSRPKTTLHLFAFFFFFVAHNFHPFSSPSRIPQFLFFSASNHLASLFSNNFYSRTIDTRTKKKNEFKNDKQLRKRFVDGGIIVYQ